MAASTYRDSLATWALPLACLTLVLAQALCAPLADAADVDNVADQNGAPRGGLPTCSLEEVALVRNMSAMAPRDYGLPGLTHLTVAGKLHHGTQEMEVWLQTIAPGSGTPVHRHDHEEIFLVVKGSGVYLRAPVAYTGNEREGAAPGEPVSVAFGANSTFVVPRNEVHQVINPATSTEDLQLYAVVSRPPVHSFIYPSWDHSHDDAISLFPMFWDRACA